MKYSKSFYLSSLLLLMNIFCSKTNGQDGIALGVKGSIGRTLLRTTAEGASKDLLVANDLSFISPELFVERSICKTLRGYAGVAYSMNRFKIQDPNSVNLTYGRESAWARHKVNTVSLHAAGRKSFALPGKFVPYAQLGLMVTFLKRGTDRYSVYGDSTEYSFYNSITSSLLFSLRPEVGASYRINDKHELGFYFTYAIGLNEMVAVNYKAYQNQMEVASASYSSNGTSMAFGFRYQYNISQRTSKEPKVIANKDKVRADTVVKSKEVKYDSKGVPKKLRDREIEKQNSINVASTEIEFFVWDDGKEEDGDIISLYIGGKWVLENYSLTREKKSVKIQINPDDKNYLIMYAINEGKFPPNTAAISVFDGKKEVKLNLKSSMKACGALIFRYKPE